MKGGCHEHQIFYRQHGFSGLPVHYLRHQHTKTSAGREAGDYDKISLNKSPYPEDDMSFARVLAREAAARLEAGVSSERVLSLKQQVESGTYRPDARRIAEKLLGYR